MTVLRSGNTAATLIAWILTTVSVAQAAPGAVTPPPRQNVVAACAPNADEPQLSLRVEVRDQFGLWRAGESVQVSTMSGFPLAAIDCDGPWANFRLEPGKYRVMASLGPERSQEIEVDVPSAGMTVTLMLEPPPGTQTTQTDLSELTSSPPPAA